MSPDGTRIAFTVNDVMKVMDMDFHEVASVAAGPDHTLFPITFTTDAKRVLAYVARTKYNPNNPAYNKQAVVGFEGLRVVTIGDERSKTEVVALAGSAGIGMAPSPCWLQEAHHIAGICGSQIILWDATSGNELARFPAPPLVDDCVCAAFSHDGKRIAWGHSNGKLSVWDAVSGLKVMNGHSQEIKSVAFSPDGKRLVSGSARQDAASLGRCDRQPGANSQRAHGGRS